MMKLLIVVYYDLRLYKINCLSYYFSMYCQNFYNIPIITIIIKVITRLV